MNTPQWLLDAARETVLGRLNEIDSLIAANTVKPKRVYTKRAVSAVRDASGFITLAPAPPVKPQPKFRYKVKRVISPEAKERMRQAREDRKAKKAKAAKKAAK